MDLKEASEHFASRSAGHPDHAEKVAESEAQKASNEANVSIEPTKTVAPVVELPTPDEVEALPELEAEVEDDPDLEEEDE